ncbi:hypothetical protein FB474_0836 [Oryzihumus leptocrescens]|uniref:DUF559 domain-containing protein n=1 Tax=Oryzihumus leptocrescens TaxID=297536 RepID=A0A542ZGK0_9MICO|nr:hypothetical protein FB474_0836 [Oryzihumus leptocrescens]
MALGPFSTEEGLASLTRGVLYGPSFDRVMRGVHECREPLDVPRDHGDLMHAARLALGEQAVFVGRSAAWALGSRLASPRAPVDIRVSTAHQKRCRPSVRVHHRELGPDEVVETDFGLATSPLRTALDLACGAGREWAVAACDHLLRVTALDPAHVMAEAQRVRGRRGIRQARDVAAMLDPRSESPRESLLRVHMLDFGLPRPTSQLVVLDPRGCFVGRLDFGWEEERVGIEYDGDHHREVATHSRDLWRHNRLRELGWVVFQVDAHGLLAVDNTLAAVRSLLLSRREGRSSGLGGV